MKRSSAIVFVLFLAAAVFSGCGDDDGGGGGGGGGIVTLVTVTDFQTAGTVIGQATFTSGVSHPTASNTVGADYGNPLVLNGRLYLPDYTNSRVLVFNSIPTGTNASADFVLGQPDMVSTATGSAADQMDGPQTARAYSGKLFVSEYSNSRILIWNSAPTSTQTPADIVVGQPGFGTVVTACTQTGLSGPEDFTIAGGKLIASDSNNNRVLIWNTIPTSNGAPADVVLGQNSFTTCVKNDDLQTGVTGTASARTLSYPAGIWSDGTRLVVADADNHRVLIWNSIPTTNFTPANRVLGQSDFSHITANDDLQTGVTGTTPSARTFYFPYFLDSNGVQLFVADETNNRVLVWNSFPASNFAPADRVLGQGDFSHAAFNDDNQDRASDANPTARTLRSPRGVYVYGPKLFVTDGSNNRFLVFDSQ